MGMSVSGWQPGQPLHGMDDEELLKLAHHQADDCMQHIFNSVHDHFNYIPKNKLAARVFSLGRIDAFSVESAAYRILEEWHGSDWYEAVTKWCDDVEAYELLRDLVEETERRGIRDRIRSPYE